MSSHLYHWSLFPGFQTKHFPCFLVCFSHSELLPQVYKPAGSCVQAADSLHERILTSKSRSSWYLHDNEASKTPIGFSGINGHDIFGISSFQQYQLTPAWTSNAAYRGCCLLVLLASGLDIAYSESKCEPVFEYFPYCLDFLTGYYNKPSKRCCDHIYKLNRLAKRGLGAQLICWCIEYMVRGTEPRIRADRISELPTKCQTHLSFPISEWKDCNTYSLLSFSFSFPYS